MTNLLIANILCFLFLVFFIHDGFKDYKREIYRCITEQNNNLEPSVIHKAFMIVTVLVFLISIPLVAIYVVGVILNAFITGNRK